MWSLSLVLRSQQAVVLARRGPTLMIEFVFLNYRVFYPTFRINCPEGSHLPRWGLILPRKPAPTPVLYSAVTNPFRAQIRGYVRTQDTPNPTPRHPFSWPDFESGQMNCCLGKMDPNWAKCLKSGQKFSTSGQKKKCIPLSMEGAEAVIVSW